MSKSECRQDKRANTTATTSATLLDSGASRSLAEPDAPCDDAQAAPAMHESKPLLKAEPSVHNLTVESVEGVVSSCSARTCAGYGPNFDGLWNSCRSVQGLTSLLGARRE